MLTKNKIRILAGIVLLSVIVIAITFRDAVNPQDLKQSLDNLGPAAPLIFMAIYIIATVIWLPGSVFSITGGLLFGPVLGTFYNLTAATIGATLAFLIARYLAADWVAEKSAGKLKKMINGVDEEGWRFVAFVRLVPLFPFNILNYALGLTRIPLLHYVLASYICMLPGAFVYTYIGYAGAETLKGGDSFLQNILIAVALLAVIAYLPRIVKKLRKSPGNS
jgi:uncharacterized membrane protein YdjX (TVP38/TMEM64 family)